MPLKSVRVKFIFINRGFVIVSCPEPPRTCKKVFWALSCQMGRGSSPRSESSNQIAERLIICDDVGNRARDLALQTEGKLLSQLISYVLGRSKVGCSLLEFERRCWTLAEESYRRHSLVSSCALQPACSASGADPEKWNERGVPKMCRKTSG